MCKGIARRKERGAKGSLGNQGLSHETKERIEALEKLCRDRWRIRSVHNRIARIRRLSKKGAIEKILRICRTQKRFSRELFRTGQKVAVSLGERFERVCERDVPLVWLEKRLVEWKDKAGPATCRRAQRFFAGLVSRYPEDPMVHVAEVWLKGVCGRYMKK